MLRDHHQVPQGSGRSVSRVAFERYLDFGCPAYEALLRTCGVIGLGLTALFRSLSGSRGSVATG